MPAVRILYCAAGKYRLLDPSAAPALSPGLPAPAPRAPWCACAAAGTVEIWSHPPGNRHDRTIITVLKKGQSFGELAIINDEQRAEVRGMMSHRSPNDCELASCVAIHFMPSGSWPSSTASSAQTCAAAGGGRGLIRLVDVMTDGRNLVLPINQSMTVDGPTGSACNAMQCTQ